MDDAYANALKRKKELEAELKAVDQFLTQYKQFAGADSSRVNRKTRGVPTKNVRRRSSPKQFVTMIENVLRRAAKPMTRGEIAAEFERQGVALPSADAARYLGTIMWRNSKKFENLEGQGYWLRGIKVPDPKNPDEMFSVILSAQQ
jgi:hypothetical protein